MPCILHSTNCYIRDSKKNSLRSTILVDCGKPIIQCAEWLASIVRKKYASEIKDRALGCNVLSCYSE